MDLTRKEIEYWRELLNSFCRPDRNSKIDALCDMALRSIPEGWKASPFIGENFKAQLGQGTDDEERMIDAGTRYITQTIWDYPIGDRRFTIGLFNAMLSAAPKVEL